MVRGVNDCALSLTHETLICGGLGPLHGIRTMVPERIKVSSSSLHRRRQNSFAENDKLFLAEAGLRKKGPRRLLRRRCVGRSILVQKMARAFKSCRVDSCVQHLVRDSATCTPGRKAVGY